MSSAPAIRGFVWQRQLGRGGFADVHLYRQEQPARSVAVKVPRDRHDLRGAQAVRREADALAQVAGHPGVVGLYSTGLTDDARPYLALEHCRQSFAQILRSTGPLPVQQALDVSVRLCSALNTLHRRGLVHRDVKPGNVMLTEWGSPVLVDFGSCLGVHQQDDLGTEFSPAYAPPEQQQGAPAAATMDVWALAATCWALLTGHSPFEDGRPGPLPPLPAPPPLRDVLRDALTADPARRTPDAAALGTALRQVQHHLGWPVTAWDGGGAPGTEPAGDHGPLWVDPGGAEDTIIRPRTATPAPAAGRRRVSPVGVILLVLVAVIVSGGAVAGVLLGVPQGESGPTPAEGTTQDAVPAPPGAPTDLVGEVRDGRVHWSWRASPTPGVSYVVTLSRPGVDPVERGVPLNTFDSEAVPGRNCLLVRAVGADGRPSADLQTCVDV